MKKPPVWLNRACLGPSNVPTGEIDTGRAAATLRESYHCCINWVAEWCGVDPARVLLTGGATDALDVALTTRQGLPSVIIHTDLAHESTRSSAACAADFLGSIGGCAIRVNAIVISDLFDRDPGAFAAEVVKRTAAACGTGRGILVLEHVTSRNGHCLPLMEISVWMQSHLPGIDLVIDGAQAAGICRPPGGFSGAYAACFHKYIDGPAGTGFCVLPEGLSSKALHRVRATRMESDGGACGEHMPTTDVAKWEACAQAVDELRTRMTPDERLARVLDLRRKLLDRLSAVLCAPCASREEYGSHIVAIDIPDKVAATVWRGLLNHGFSTKQLNDGIRVTLDDTLDPATIDAFVNAFATLAVGEQQS